VGNTIVNEEKARAFLKNATKIINTLKEVLPEELRWPEYTHNTKFSFVQPILSKGNEQ